MGAMMDATCPKCRKRIGWQGKNVDRPKCPKCGYLPDRETLESADRQLDQLLADMQADTRTADGATLKRLRAMSGLSLEQIYREAGIPRLVLDGMEKCSDYKLAPQVYDALNKLYGCGLS